MFDRRTASVSDARAPVDADEQGTIDRFLAQIDTIVAAAPDRHAPDGKKGKAGVVSATAALAMAVVAGLAIVHPSAHFASLDTMPLHATPTLPGPSSASGQTQREFTPAVPSAPAAGSDRREPVAVMPEPRTVAMAPPDRRQIKPGRGHLSLDLTALPPDPPALLQPANPSGNGEVARHLTGEAQRLALIADAENTRALNRGELETLPAR
ncbi:hypothetical protein [Sphingomonas sp.]|uniref:hypothetical protein n=1 Tax=Sphingomonas sp. TaxID=28214 RepID=UPI003CC58FCA